MRRLGKISTSILLSLMLILSSFSVTVSAATAEIVVQTFTISETGSVEVYGYIDGAPIISGGYQVTFLLVEGSDWNALNSNNAGEIIAYIDQQGTSNNNSFLFKCQIADKFLGKTLTLGMNSNADTELFKETIDANESEFSLKTIANNDVIYGADAYQLTSPQLTARNVADSLVYGGNKIYYKLGNEWYDLLDEDAVDNSYLVPNNKVNYSDMQDMSLRYYYKGDDRLTFVSN